MKKYHYATVSLSALCLAAKVPTHKDSYLAEDADSRAISNLLKTGYRLTKTIEQSDCAIFEKEIDAVSPAFDLASRGMDNETILRELLEAGEEAHGPDVCDCRPEPENDGHICCWCKARIALGIGIHGKRA